MDNIPIDNPSYSASSDHTKITPGDNTEVVSQLMSHFDDHDDEDRIFQDINSDNEDDHDRVYDAIFGGKRDIDHSSIRSSPTIRRTNRSTPNSSSQDKRKGNYLLNNLRYQYESFMKQKRGKCVLLTILVIFTIIYISTNMPRNKIISSENNDNSKQQWWNKKKFHKDTKGDDLEYDDALGNGVGFDSFHNGMDTTTSEVNEEQQGDENYDTLFGQHDEGDNMYSTTPGGFKYYDEGEETLVNDGTITDKNAEKYASEETEVDTDLDSSTSYETSLNLLNETSPDDDIENNELSSEDEPFQITNDFTIDDLEERFGDVDEPFEPNSHQVPFLFFIARTGATLVEELLMKCHGLVAASGRGDLGDGEEKATLEVITTQYKERYVNVDLRNPEGVDRAIDLDLIGSNLAQFIVAQRINLASSIFHSPFEGKCFTMMRHPVDRAISVFYALKNSPWEHSYEQDFVDMTIEDYAFSPYVESNWITRMLTNKMSGQIDINDFDDAKDFLSKKCLIGLTEQFEESHRKIEKYFGWESSGDPICEDEVALENEFDGTDDRLRRLGKNKLSQKAYDRISDLNELDLRLYEYALELFEEQKSLPAFQ